MDIPGFLKAVSSDWVALMSGVGSIAMLILGITVFHKKSIPRWLVLVVAAVCLVCASARVWTTENRKYQAEIKIEEDKNKPGLSATLDGVAIAPGRPPHDCVVTAWMTIRNVGAQSIAENFTLKVVTTSGMISHGTYVSPPPENERINLGIGEKDTSTALLFRKDSLALKATETPIQHNGEASGFLMFYISGVDRNELKEKGSIIELEFTDIFGKSYTASRAMTGTESIPLDVHKLQGSP
jgi:hypothetical protein